LVEWRTGQLPSGRGPLLLYPTCSWLVSGSDLNLQWPCLLQPRGQTRQKQNSPVHVINYPSNPVLPFSTPFSHSARFVHQFSSALEPRMETFDKILIRLVQIRGFLSRSSGFLTTARHASSLSDPLEILPVRCDLLRPSPQLLATKRRESITPLPYLPACLPSPSYASLGDSENPNPFCSKTPHVWVNQ
jgi:hypothetical protein